MVYYTVTFFSNSYAICCTSNVLKGFSCHLPVQNLLRIFHQTVAAPVNTIVPPSLRSSLQYPAIRAVSCKCRATLINVNY